MESVVAFGFTEISGLSLLADEVQVMDPGAAEQTGLVQAGCCFHTTLVTLYCCGNFILDPWRPSQSVSE